MKTQTLFRKNPVYENQDLDQLIPDHKKFDSVPDVQKMNVNHEEQIRMNNENIKKLLNIDIISNNNHPTVFDEKAPHQLSQVSQLIEETKARMNRFKVDQETNLLKVNRKLNEIDERTNYINTDKNEQPEAKMVESTPGTNNNPENIFSNSTIKKNYN